MIKYKKSIQLLLCLCLFGIVGCSKFLEKDPDNRTELNSPEKVGLLLTSAYPKGNYIAMYESASDNAGDRGLATSEAILNTDSYFFDSTHSGSDQDTPEFYWTECYAAIAAANNALEVINNTGADSVNYLSMKGEALLCRAYAHFMLVTTFGDPYDPAGTNEALSIPYVEVPETKLMQKYKRLSVKDVYDKIERDLLTGLPLLDDDRYDRPKWHFTTVAANAFATRFFLFKKDYTKVIAYANASFPGTSISAYMRPWNTVYKTYTESEQRTNYTKADQSAILLIAEANSWWARNFNSYRYGYNQAIANQVIFRAALPGGNWAQRSKAYYYGGNNERQGIAKWNEYFVETNLNSQIGQGYDMIPLFTAEEVLFNRAEAEAYLGQEDAALGDLTIYAASHIDSYNASTNAVTMTKINNYFTNYGSELGDDVPNLVKAVLNFKRVEYIQEGLRWLDVLRYKIPITHTGSILGASRTETLAPNDKRRKFSIPQTAFQGFEN